MGARLGFGDPRDCCPGQTGHHLVPDAMMRPGPGQRRVQGNSNCIGYDEKKAPTVCVEGAGANTGSHATIHTVTEAEIAEKMNTDGSISMERSIQAATDSTTGVCSSLLETSRQPRPRTASMHETMSSLWWRDSNQMASGKLGAGHYLLLHGLYIC